jgi:tetratricopeptide (TPR) repeat protein
VAARPLASLREGVAYWALGEIVKAQAGILESDTADAAMEKLRRAVSDFVELADVPWVESHLRPLVGLGGDQGGGEERRSEAFAAWRRFLEALAEANPLVLVFEDLQWADEGLLDFVDYLVEWASGVPLLVVCSGRPELLERRPGWGGGKRNSATVSLSPLSSEDTARLVAALLEQAVLPAEVQQTLLARAEGNPLYAEEYARVLLERGSAESLPLPETLQGLIAARLDALSPEEKELVQDAAVIGKVFWTGALAATGAQQSFHVEERLHGLERKEFVRRERRALVAGETQYAFLHVLVRDVAYGQIPRARRAEKHRLAAEWIAGLASDRAEDHAEMLAHHYLEAIELTQAAGLDAEQLSEPARRALRDAGDRAFSLSAPQAADGYYRAALRLWPLDDPERPRLLFSAGRTLGDFLDADVELLAEASAGLIALGDRELAAEAEAQIALAHWARAERDIAYEHMDRALSFVADAPASPAKASVLSWRAAFFMLAGENDEAIRCGREALALAEALGLDEIRSNCLNTIGGARVEAGDPGGTAELEQAIELARRINSSAMIQRGLNNLANMYWHLGRLREASELVTEMRDHGERMGLPAMLGWVAGEEVFDRYVSGRWAEALRLAQDFIADLDTTGAHYLEASVCGLRAAVLVAAGDTSTADADTARALELARHAQDPQILAPALIESATVLRAVGRASGASALLDELFALKSGNVDFVTNAYLAHLARIAAAEGRSDQFLAGIADALPGPWRDAAVATASGRHAEAADIFARMGARGEEAVARLAAAEQLVGEGRRAEADEQLHPALAFFRDAGATAYLREGERLLAASA